ncbi:hypothetical protein NPIL_516891, partial [Nephila pilipes]
MQKDLFLALLELLKKIRKSNERNQTEGRLTGTVVGQEPSAVDL